MDDVEFSAEDATRSDIDFLAQLVAATIEAGATTINLPDTVGYSTPNDYAQMFREIRSRVPAVAGVTLSAHCHDDLGMAVANSLASIEGGVRQIECTINGIGERAGNAALEEIAAALMVRRDKYPYPHSLKNDRLFSTSQMLGERISFRPAPNKAVVGSNAFAHEAGIHQHGMLANPLTYEIMTPASVGRAVQQHGAGQALRPARSGASPAGTRPYARCGGARSLLPPLCRAGRSQEGHL